MSIKKSIARSTALTISNFGPNRQFTAKELASMIQDEFPGRRITGGVCAFLSAAHKQGVLQRGKRNGLWHYALGSNKAKERFRRWLAQRNWHNGPAPYNKGQRAPAPAAPEQGELSLEQAQHNLDEMMQTAFPEQPETLVLEVTLSGNSAMLAPLIFELMNQPQVLGVAIQPQEPKQ